MKEVLRSIHVKRIDMRTGDIIIIGYTLVTSEARALMEEAAQNEADELDDVKYISKVIHKDFTKSRCSLVGRNSQVIIAYYQEWSDGG